MCVLQVKTASSADYLIVTKKPTQVTLAMQLMCYPQYLDKEILFLARTHSIFLDLLDPSINKVSLFDFLMNT